MTNDNRKSPETVEKVDLVKYAGYEYPLDPLERTILGRKDLSDADRKGRYSDFGNG